MSEIINYRELPADRQHERLTTIFPGDPVGDLIGFREEQEAILAEEAEVAIAALRQLECEAKDARLA